MKSTVGFFSPAFKSITGLSSKDKEQETAPSKTTVSNLMYFLSVFSPIEFKF